MKPMLAFPYVTHRRHVHYPCHVQPKLDGHRALAFNNVLQSRGEHTWPDNMLEHIRVEIQQYGQPNIVYDAELWVPGWTLNRIQSAVKRLTPSADTHRIQLHVFDAVDPYNITEPFSERFVRLCQPLTARAKHLKLIDTKVCLSESQGDAMYNEYREAGYEGMMYRRSEAPYSFVEYCGNQENRATQLIKRKLWIDEWFKVIDFTFGEGKHVGVIGAVVCITKANRIFKVGTGFSDEERKYYMQNGVDNLEAHVKFECYSEFGVPLKPTLLDIKNGYIAP